MLPVLASSPDRAQNLTSREHLAASRRPATANRSSWFIIKPVIVSSKVAKAAKLSVRSKGNALAELERRVGRGRPRAAQVAARRPPPNSDKTNMSTLVHSHMAEVPRFPATCARACPRPPHYLRQPLECETPMRDQAKTKFPTTTGSLFLRHSTLDKQCFSRVVKLFTMRHRVARPIQ